MDKCIKCPICDARHLLQQDRIQNGVFAATCENCGHFIKFRVQTEVNSQITLTVNGQQYTVGNKYPPWTTLSTYLRNERISVGTKVMCHEGGCGICVVQAKLYEPLSDSKKGYPINSCMCPLFMCDGWEITTVEGIDDTIPMRLAKYNGSQCGYCSPGQVMNMHALLDNNGGRVTMKQVEDAYDNVICRCTGYRPILDAMKSFAQDSPAMRKTSTVDIEELGQKFCPKTGDRCYGKCHSKRGEQLQVVGSDAVWYRPATFDQLFKTLSDNSAKKCRIVFGNTGSGVYRELSPSNYDVLVDVRGIQEMFAVNFDPTVVLGAGLSITQLIDVCTRTKAEPQFGHLEHVMNMLKRVAGHSIRSLGSWAGNIMMKHLHPEFQSDVYVSLEAANVKLMIANSNGSTEVPMEQFLQTDMTNKIVVAMILPSMTNDYMVRLYKVALRAENSHSFVNAGIRMKIDKKNKFMVMEKPCIVFSGISKDFVHATQTESYLQGKSLADPAVIKGAITMLASEVNPDPNIDQVEPSVGYRKNVAIAYLYSYILEAIGDAAAAKYRSGATPLSRPLSSGQQSYDTKTMEWPLTEPLMKLEALNQTRGRAEYINDIPECQQTLHAAFVLSTEANATIERMDASQALKLPGVTRFITASDIPGENNCFPPFVPFIPPTPEEVFVSKQVEYVGQAIGLIVAEDEDTARRAARMVQVTYSNQKPAILTIEDAIKQNSFFPDSIYLPDMKKGDAQAAFSKSPKQITGSVSLGEQQHFQMETQIAVCRPTEDGMDVQASTQSIDNTQKSVGMVLGVPFSSINVSVKRLGGAYGSKITRNFKVSAACAVAAHVLKRPVKLNMEFHANMKMIGRRFGYRADYKVGCTNEGKLNSVEITLYCDFGYLNNEDVMYSTFGFLDNAYYCPNVHYIPKEVRTNKAMNISCRAPGSTPAIFIIESIMERIAKELNLDPTDLRVLNMYNPGQSTPGGHVLKYCNIRELVTNLMTSANIKERQGNITVFNQANRWKKKGLSVVPMKFEIAYSLVHYNAIVDVLAGDGSVAIAHGGVECGQGINTKVKLVDEKF